MVLVTQKARREILLLDENSIEKYQMKIKNMRLA